MRAKFIYEKFIEDSDPIQDMGIGIGKYLSKICKLILEKDTAKQFWTIKFNNNSIEIYLNVPKVAEDYKLKNNEDVHNYVKKIIDGINLKYTDLFTNINIHGKFSYRFIDPDTDEKVLSQAPRISCTLNKSIKSKYNSITIRRKRDSEEFEEIVK
jgi:hypothetical protein